MGIINQTLFSFVNVNNLCYFHNKTVVPRDYILSKYDCKTNMYIEVQTGTILENDILDLKDIIKDGRYLLEIPVGKHNIYFSKYNCLRDKIIKLINKAVCSSCNCNDCNNIDCINKKFIQCIKNQQLFTLLNSYISLIKKDTYNTLPVDTFAINTTIYDLISLSFNSNICETELLVYSQLLDNCINHNTEVDDNLFKKFIGLYYLVLYRYEYDVLTTDYGNILSFDKDKELIELDNIYKYNIIKACLLKVNVTLSNLIKEIDNLNITLDNSKIYYYKTELGNNDVNVTNKPFILYSVAKQGYLYDLPTLGQINFIIETINPSLFSIEDLLGNDVTSDFSVTPYSSNLHHFKSINLITPSSVYFKIKQI